MKHSVKFSDAIHILVYIEMLQGTDLSSEVIAKSVNANPVSVRRIMSSLKKAGLIISQSGKANPKLSREPAAISFYDIYQAIDEEQQIFRVDEKTAPACIVGGNIQGVLAEKYDQLQRSIELEMQQINLADIIHSVSKNASQSQTIDEETAQIIQQFL
ncbi:Rrf2 family transcriptional regulator [Aerococcus viridans]|uniref:Rrf2 family transcriptional regulator n=1 Tax=Aerococcus viridans TaxID=1377 RepID=UPI0002D5065B|nr:Rrf2 family transcriptional regulator [Aerococcus viridans]